MSVTDRWHKPRSRGDELRCSSHGLVPTDDHGKGERWQVRWRDESGRQRKKNFPKKQGKDPNTCAEAFEVKIRDQLNSGTYIDPASGKVKLRTYADQWQASLSLDMVSLTNIASRFNNHVYPLIGDAAMGQLAKRPSMIQSWIKRMEAELGLSPTTIRDTVGWVSMMFNAAVDDGVVSRNPCLVGSIRKPKVVRPKAQPWELKQVEAASTALPEHLAAIPYVASGCGHRQGELFGISPDDLNFLGRTVDVQRQVRFISGHPVFRLPKGGKVRSVPMPKEVGLRLAAHIEAFPPREVTLPWGKPDGELVTVSLVFVNVAGAGPLRKEHFNNAWRMARVAAGAPDDRENGVHVLRHTAASAWLAAGVDIRTVAEFLGHSDPAFTLRVYSHLMPDAADRARKAMDLFFAGAPGESALGVPSEGK